MADQINSYRDLVAWQRARELAGQIYGTSAEFPSDERFGLTAQIRRAGISVVSNIAEGYGRGRRQDYARFLRMARGSLFELEAQLIIASDLRFLGAEPHSHAQSLVDAVARPLSGLIRKVEGE